MADCEWKSECVFINEKDIYGHDAVRCFFENQYCQNKHSNCACFMIFDALGKNSVPRNLLPNQPEKAKDVIDKACGNKVQKAGK